MGHMTEQEIAALQTSKLDRVTPFVICGVSRSYLSIARFYGGCKFQGRNYSYITTTDELLAALGEVRISARMEVTRMTPGLLSFIETAIAKVKP